MCAVSWFYYAEFTAAYPYIANVLSKISTVFLRTKGDPFQLPTPMLFSDTSCLAFSELQTFYFVFFPDPQLDVKEKPPVMHCDPFTQTVTC